MLLSFKILVVSKSLAELSDKQNDGRVNKALASCLNSLPLFKNAPIFALNKANKKSVCRNRPAFNVADGLFVKRARVCVCISQMHTSERA